jgi:hypothetical protein
MGVSDDQKRAAAVALAQKAHGSAKPPAAAPPPKTGAFAKKPAAAPANSLAHYTAFFEGFSKLLTAVVDDQGKTLDTVKFDAAVDAAGLRLLEHVRAVFLEKDKGEAKANADWPSVEAQLHKMTAEARNHGVPASIVDGVEDNIAIAADAYIHVARKGARQVETDRGYEDLLNGLEALLDVVGRESELDGKRFADQDKEEAKQRDALKAITFGPYLADRHKAILEELRHILTLARTKGHGHEAVAAWGSWVGDVNYVLHRIGELEAVDLTTYAQRENITASLNKVYQGLILGAAYQESHETQVAKVKVADAAGPKDMERLREAIMGLQHADELTKAAEDLTKKTIFELAKAKSEKAEMLETIVEAVHGGHEISEVIEELKKKHGLDEAVAIADLADKVVSTAHTLEEFTFQYVKAHAESMAKRWAEKGAEEGAEELAEHWESVGKWASESAEALKVLGTVALVVSVAVSAVKIVRYLIAGKIKEAVEEAGKAAVTIGAGMAAGAAGSAMFAGTAILIEAEINGLEGAAAMIRYCREENLKEAINDYYYAIDEFAGEAKDFIADLKILGDPAERQQWPKAKSHLDSYASWWGTCLNRLNAQMDTDSKAKIGGQPDYVKELGDATLKILRSGVPATTYEGIAEQVKTVLAGTHELSVYVAAQQKEAADEADAELKKQEEEAREEAE